MSSTIRHVTVDCRNAEAVGRFWGAALGWGEDPEFCVERSASERRADPQAAAADSLT